MYLHKLFYSCFLNVYRRERSPRVSFSTRLRLCRAWNLRGHDRCDTKSHSFHFDEVNETSSMFDTVALSSMIFCPRGPASIIRVIGISILETGQWTVGKRASASTVGIWGSYGHLRHASSASKMNDLWMWLEHARVCPLLIW